MVKRREKKRQNPREANKSLGHKQKGSRKGEEAISLVVDKQAKCSMSRLSKCNIASFDNDAKSCFDRIVMLVASLCAQRQGMSARACELLLKTLDKAQYHVKTQLGISDRYYCTTEERNRILIGESLRRTLILLRAS
jgi:hypothetical protein